MPSVDVRRDFYHDSVSTLRSFFLDGPAGRLESLLNLPPADAPNATSFSAALVCHPHPKGGGTMHNKVVYHAMKTLVALGVPVLRFNFRGTGASEGVHDDGQGEKGDVAAATEWLAQEYGAPLLSCGFSFGSALSLRVNCKDDRVAALVALGVPVAVENMRSYEYPWLAACTKPKLFISGTEDEYASPEGVERIAKSAGGANTVVLVEGADHFFQSPGGAKLAEMQTALRDWVLAQRTGA